LAIQIYKAAQGRYVRIGSALAAGCVDLTIAYYVWFLLQQHLPDVAYKTYLEYVIPGVLFVAIGVAVSLYLNKPVVVDFLVATESEMKKVSWPGRAELWGSTLVVIVTVVLLAAVISLCDLLFTHLFHWIGEW